MSISGRTLAKRKMDLIVWRHADAEDGTPDLGRALTAKGRKQAAQMGAWLHEHLPKETRVLVSPARRAQQTAEALGRAFETVDEIAPGASYRAILRAAGWPHGESTVLVVGHQPTLGETVAWLLAGEPVEWSLKKAGLIWLSHRAKQEHSEVVLRAVLSPDLL